MPIPRLNKRVHPVRVQSFLRKSGLTLIEMLIVSMILVVITLAVNSSLNSGVRVWRKINQELPQEALNIFFDKFSADLHNTLKITGIKFKGDDERLELPTAVKSESFPERSPGKIIYFYDRQKDELVRDARDYSDVYNDKRGGVRSLIKNIHKLKFSYYFFEAETKNYTWLEAWEKEGLPQAVRVELEIKDKDEIREFSRTVSIPLSN